jgi:two-component system nitrate/nitrite response regulator NarL
MTGLKPTTATTEHPVSASEPAPVRVLIADDHPLFRRGIRFSLERRQEIVVVGEADNGEDALRLIEALEPDVAVLDHRMPGLTGAEVCAALAARSDRPATALLLLSAYEDAELVWAAVSAGAAGYVGKSEPAEEICDAVARVGRGGIAYSDRAVAGVAEGLARHFGGDPDA